jgi:CRP-like cAMP-binding protein
MSSESLIAVAEAILAAARRTAANAADPPPPLDAGGDVDDEASAVDVDPMLEGGGSIADRLRLLAAARPFRELRAPDLVDLAAAAEVCSFAPGQPILRQGDAVTDTDGVYLIVAGDVEILMRAVRDGVSVETTVGWCGTGELLGELALLDGRPHAATAIAATSTRCLRIRAGAFARALDQYPALARSMLSMLADRLRTADVRFLEQRRDPITGLGTAGLAAAYYEREVARARRASRQADPPPPLAVLHVVVESVPEDPARPERAAANTVLRRVAAVLAAAAPRGTDIVVRYGPREFVVLLPEAGTTGAAVVVRRVAAALRAPRVVAAPFTIRLGSKVVTGARPQSLGDVVAAAQRTSRPLVPLAAAPDAAGGTPRRARRRTPGAAATPPAALPSTGEPDATE